MISASSKKKTVSESRIEMDKDTFSPESEGSRCRTSRCGWRARRGYPTRHSDRTHSGQFRSRPGSCPPPHLCAVNPPEETKHLICDRNIIRLAFGNETPSFSRIEQILFVKGL
ncbi:hypothetical protein TNIN_86351 [Trichonephila inaurata madagascariensis]|uniref:Uncharacterized protein n=1 Tax=Trichonephila inaurata madagascariensis TaxID=2747483 RepID=A0A8X7BPI8_9ARAC|nr:hypothetical protein TNIN_86351 [Trichonephila inaurata madagascariensis]